MCLSHHLHRHLALCIHSPGFCAFDSVINNKQNPVLCLSSSFEQVANDSGPWHPGDRTSSILDREGCAAQPLFRPLVTMESKVPKGP